MLISLENLLFTVLGVTIMIKYSNSHGDITLAPELFTNLVGDAATNCFGVKGMAMRSVSDGLVHLLKRESMGKGVYLSYHEDSSVDIELHIIVNSGVNIPELCRSIIREVAFKVSAATGVVIGSVNVFVDSISID